MLFKRKKPKNETLTISQSVRSDIIEKRDFHEERAQFYRNVIERAQNFLREHENAHNAYCIAIQSMIDAENAQAEADIEQIVLDLHDDQISPFDQGIWTECHVFNTGKEPITPPAEPVNMPGYPITKMMHNSPNSIIHYLREYDGE